MKLYHGSYLTITVPELSKCMDGKDFGKGFYLTSSKKQAERFVKSAVGKALKNGSIAKQYGLGYVSVYEFEEIEGLNVYKFQTADESWLKCIAGHRRKGLFESEIDKWSQYDIIIGKIANDTTNRILTNYINGDFGSVSSKRAIDFAIDMLMPEKLVDQVCFRTDKALACLKFIESYEVKFI